MIPNLYSDVLGSWRKTTLFSLFLSLFFTAFTATMASAQCEAAAGTLGGAQICKSAEKTVIQATPNEDAIVPDGYLRLYVLTRGDSLVIEGVSPQAAFEVQDSGSYTIHTLIFDPTTLNLGIVEFGTTTGFDVNGLLVQGGGGICAALDVAGAKFAFENCVEVCGAFAGTLALTTDDCLPDTVRDIAATHVAPPLVPEGFSVIYVLTSGEELTIQGVNATPEFTVDTTGRFTIHTLVYDTATLDLGVVEIGVTTGVDVLNLIEANGICASLDAAGAPVNIGDCPCLAEAGTLVADSIAACLDTSLTLVAFEGEAPVVPDGYSVIYVLTSGTELTIQGVNSTPEFTVDTTGRFTIHTLVFDPATLDLGVVEIGVTTGVDVLNLLAANNICASLDAAGAPFDVEACPEVCEANAGTLVAGDACLENGSATLTATEGTAPTVPAGYSVIYVLTSGEALTIQGVGATPEFTVDTTGRFTIHTLVYDTATLDLSVVEVGVTTGVDVLNLVAANGICASLDAAGAPFDVEICVDDVCEADAGTLVAGDACLENGSATLTATEGTAPTVPAGYSLIYVLTSGEELTIQGVNATPEFTVDTTGRFTIHTLVYDPATLDLGVVEVGVTTGVDVLNLVAANGICASLDAAGAPFNVSECTTDGLCEVTAGSLKATNVSCFENNFATFRARLVNQPVVPAGYEILYVLTKGKYLVIEQVSTIPFFKVDKTGLYTVHTLVYNPNTLDLSIVEFGKTTGFDVNNLLVQGGGDICAALDVKGVCAYIDYCYCRAEAGTLEVKSEGCINGGIAATLEAQVVKQPYLPSPYYALRYVLTSGDNLIIEGLSAEPTFNVTKPGKYRIHSFVYNYNDLDLSGVKLGTTSAVEVLGLISQGGGSACGSLDVAGAVFNVGTCQVNLQTPTMYPNPAQQRINILIPANLADKDMNIEILDATGNLMLIRKAEAGTRKLDIEVADWTSGMYVIRFNYGQGQIKKMQFTKF